MSSTNSDDMIVVRIDTIIYDYDTDFAEPDINTYLVYRGDQNSCLEYCNNAFAILFNQCKPMNILNSINQRGTFKLSFFGDEQCSMIVTAKWQILRLSDIYKETEICKIADNCIYVLSDGNQILHIFHSQEESEEFLETNKGYRKVPLVCHLNWWYSYNQPKWFWYDEDKGGIGVTEGGTIPFSNSNILIVHYHL